VRSAGKWLGGAVAFVSLIGACAYGCGPTVPSFRAAPPPQLAPQIPVVMPSITAAPAPAPPPFEVGFDPATVKPILDDPRLAAVKVAVEQEAFVKAVELLAANIAGTPPPDATDKPAWLYQLGQLRVRAGDPLGAAKAYEESAALGGPLTDYALYQAADIYARAGKDDKALALARKVSPGLGIADELELVLADALEGTGDIEGAAASWRAFLTRQPRSWVNVTLKLANALLKHPSDGHNEQAVKLARTIIDGSSGAGVGEAKEIEKKGLQLLPAKRRKALETPSSDELLGRARRLVAAGQSKEAIKVIELLVKGASVPKAKEKACEARLLHGEVLGKLKRKAESAAAYDEAVAPCEDTARHVEALYYAGKALSTTGRHAEGERRLAEVEKVYPKSRLAEHARVRRAKTALDNGDEATFAKLLTALPFDYPQSSLVNDGLFDLGVHYAEKRLWAAAIPPLSRAFELEKDKRERVFHSAGRFGYFLGRALIETGSEAKGKEYLAGVIQSYPLTYYMALAHARLAERDPAAARRALDEAIAREVNEPFYVPPHPSLKSPAFLRAVELVRQGDVKLARGELDLLGVGARTAPREVLWASALLLAKVGASQQSAGLLRAASSSASSSTELVDWLEHYPAGKWRTPWELSFPRPYADLVSAAAAQAAIPEALAFAIMREESAFEPRAVSGAPAYGLMQLISATAKTMAKPLGLPFDPESLKKPHVNIALGCRYLGILRKKFPDNVLLSIPGYNAGPGAPKKWLVERAGYDFDVWVERIPYDETQKYTKRVIGSMATYEWLYWQDKPTEARATPRAAGTVQAAVASAATPALPAIASAAPSDPPPASSDAPPAPSDAPATPGDAPAAPADAP